MLSVKKSAEAYVSERGSCIPLSLFLEEKGTGSFLENKGEFERKYPGLVGLTVDYLTRFSLGYEVKKAFEISIQGMKIYLEENERKAPGGDFKDLIKMYVFFLSSIVGLDDVSIEMACRVVAFDDIVRGRYLMVSPPRLQPDQKSIKNIREMVLRSKSFFLKNGPVIDTGFEFDPKGYSDVVSMGDGDYLTENSMWDMKVLARKPNPSERLQVLMYWIMGQHSGNPALIKVSGTGIYNPRMDVSYLLDCKSLDLSLIQNIERNIICYKNRRNER